MWFKNLYLFRLTQPLELDHDALHAALEPHLFQPVGKAVPFSYGWSTPLGRHGSELCHTVGSCSMLCAKKEERLLPAAVVNEQLAEKVEEIEQAEARPVGRKERQQLKEELTLTLLPQAFTRSGRTFAYIDRSGDWLVVDAAAANKAEALIALLRESLEEAGTALRARLPDTAESPRTVMTRWLNGEGIPAAFELGDEYELQDAEKEGGIVRCRRQEPFSEEVQTHLSAGKQVTKLALVWRERLEFVLGEDLTVKRLRFTDALKQEMDQEHEDPVVQFDSDFAFMTVELSKFIAELIVALGGENEAEPV
ncbi:MAG: recombination-associated protein RdgC [Gammaproteobacteria bacterium]|nr:recombination-associated protein RdgC [Gammaproteobacteria bacterium]MCW8841185.1 recombination-associated protein RdgC [Gammaproteobacteria bacterium]MCW8927384.1 recombination-associated protein RdgC [Gammaproteobacteria bacterium]MCW8959408.1 recombination-associated protein RdgC [Gammaproteobacteria bacterium]MCW8973949.1 recombination-associated protein RdgC [Gammaproteobacteria bacterium]